MHLWTHLHPRSVELLLKLSGKLHPDMAIEIASVQGECTACMRSEDPPPAHKFSMSRIHLKFNERVYIDFIYGGTELAFHAVDYTTCYSKVSVIPP